MHLTKMQLVQRWQVTNLGEPSKIIDIEITYRYNTISISQKKYIEPPSIQRRNGVRESNSDIIRLCHFHFAEPKSK